MQTEQFIQKLLSETEVIISKVNRLKSYDLELLRWRESDVSWNVLECLEHLNLYGDFYLPVMERNIRHSSSSGEAEFKSGMLGGYFAKSMLPKGKLNRMKTFKDKNPLNSKLDGAVLDRFLEQQDKLIILLDSARTVSLNKVKIELSITKFLKLRLGDVFQFYINHMMRHMNQIDGIFAAQDIKK